MGDVVSSTSAAVDELAVLMAERGRRSYGEKVTIAEHCLLTAAVARQNGEADSFVAACLLHDVGHFLVDPDDDYGVHFHGDIGGDWVAARFGSEVSEPVRLHIEAKRYLCATDASYHDELSPASQYTLAKQGGPMSVEQVEQFLALPHSASAVRLRRYEDGKGKRSASVMPELSDFEMLLTGLEINETASS